MYALWTVLSFNLLLTGDFNALNSLVMATWTNDIAVGINQDALGVPAQRIDDAKLLGPGTVLSSPYDPHQEDHQLGANIALMSVAECGGEPDQQKFTFTKGVISNAATGTFINVPGCKTEVVYDPIDSTGPSCGPSKDSSKNWTITPTGQLQSAANGDCATLQSDKSVKLAKCITPLAAAQTWKYDKASLQLTSSDGMCFTASSPTSKIKQTTMVIGRPLSQSAFAILFVNNHNTTQHVTCDASCMSNLIALKPKSDGRTREQLQAQAAGTYTLEEVWTGTKIPGVSIKCTATGCDPVTVNVAAFGGATYVRMLPDTLKVGVLGDDEVAYCCNAQQCLREPELKIGDQCVDDGQPATNYEDCVDSCMKR